MRIEEGPDGVGEVEAAVLETGTVLGLVPFVFAYYPSLLLVERFDFAELLGIVCRLFLSIWLLSTALSGFDRQRLPVAAIGIRLGLAFAVLVTTWQVYLPACVLGVAVVGLHRWRGRPERTGARSVSSGPGPLARRRAFDQTRRMRFARFASVPEPQFGTAPGAPHCTYPVRYPGPAEDTSAWLAHYLDNHTRIMATFPGIREVEVCSRLDRCSALPWPRVNRMQRNKTVFDDAAALKAALASPVMQDMRADFHTLPPFRGGNVHYPMATVAAAGSRYPG